jgi:hypothetical protein
MHPLLGILMVVTFVGGLYLWVFGLTHPARVDRVELVGFVVFLILFFWFWH